MTVHREQNMKKEDQQDATIRCLLLTSVSKMFRASFPDYVTMAQDGGKVVSLTHRPPLTLGNNPGTHFC
jgi:hypothetical protein